MTKHFKNSTRLIAAGIAVATIFTGCGSSSSAVNHNVVMDENFKEYNTVLEDGKYYVRHADGTYDVTYLGNAAFSEGDTNADAADFQRIAWYKDDFEQIPTLYKGDSLIMYTEEIFDEHFVFERFYDYGYSVGIRNLVVTDSGRYKISTEDEEEDDMCTYPKGDTDAINELINETVIIDKLGGVKLRDSGDDENSFSFLTKAGTIGGLEKDAKYLAEVYEGTVQHIYTFEANVRILGEFEISKSTNYEFESTTIINIEIPDDWNSGYYMVNGVGLFRYVDGDSYDDETDFNIANFVDENENGIDDALESNSNNDDEDNIFYEHNSGGSVTYNQESMSVANPGYYLDSDGNVIDGDEMLDNSGNTTTGGTTDGSTDYQTKTIEIDDDGSVTVTVEVRNRISTDSSAIIAGADSATGYKMSVSDYKFTSSFTANAGTYTIYLYGVSVDDVIDIDVDYE